MRKSSSLLVLVALLLAFCTAPMWPQTTSAQVQGKITDNGNPVSNAMVSLTNTVTARVYKFKTDKSGVFAGVGVAFGEYKVEIVSAAGEKLLTVSQPIKGPDVTVLNLDITRDAPSSAKPALSKEQIDAMRAEREKAMTANALITQARNAMNTKDWQAAIPPLQHLTALDPKSWEYGQALGNAYFNLGRYEEAIDAFEKGIANARTALAAGAPKSDPIKIKAAMGQMLTNGGNCYLKLKKNDFAVTSYMKAAEIDPKPATAYFNLCATLYNTGNSDKVVGACEKAIAADPGKADAYFIKGMVLFGYSKSDAGKLVPPPGTIEALKKYLELAPQGSHAADVKQMLAAAGAQ